MNEMVVIDYYLSSTATNQMDESDLSRASLTDLIVNLFCGDITFRIDGSVFDASWCWGGILDFAIQLYDITRHLTDEKVETLDFVDADAHIWFRRLGKEVEVSSDYADAKAKVSLPDLQRAANDFMLRVLDDLRRWPSIERNPIYCKLRDLVDSNTPERIEEVLSNLFRGKRTL